MNFFFDSIIVLYLIASSTLAIALLRDRKRPGSLEARHPRLAFTAFMLLCSSALLIFWGSFIEPRLITINRVSIDLPNFEPTKPVRVALISDIHVGTYKKAGWVSRVSTRITKEKPDLVLLAGDFIVEKSEHAQYLSAFSTLPPQFPTYAVLGDHDYHVNQGYKLDLTLAQTVYNALANAGVQVLDNEAAEINLHDASFTLIGLDDWTAGRTRMQSCASACVALIHNPDFILDPESKKADLILAGNTHGGQIRLPFIGPIGRLPSRLPRTFDKGLFEVDEKTLLFITSGISESGPRARLFNPPEIALLELH